MLRNLLKIFEAEAVGNKSLEKRLHHSRRLYHKTHDKWEYDAHNITPLTFLFLIHKFHYHFDYFNT